MMKICFCSVENQIDCYLKFLICPGGGSHLLFKSEGRKTFGCKGISELSCSVPIYATGFPHLPVRQGS